MIVKQRKEKDSHELDFLHKVDDERSKGMSVSFLLRSITHWLLVQADFDGKVINQVS